MFPGHHPMFPGDRPRSALLDAASKGLLLYTDAVVRGDTQLRLTCERGTALSEVSPNPNLTLNPNPKP